MSTVTDCVAKHKQCLGPHPSPEQACRCTFEFVQCIHCGMHEDVAAALIPGVKKKPAAIKRSKKKK